MRRTFFQELHKTMQENPNVWALTGDLGFGGFDQIMKDFPDRFVNTGAAEQSLVGIAVGLALKGKIPFVYSITNFLIYRPFETIKLYLDGEKIPVKLVGSGMGTDYHIDGPSHDMTGVEDVLSLFSNINKLYPHSKDQIADMVKLMTEDDKPYFIGLRR